MKTTLIQGMSDGYAKHGLLHGGLSGKFQVLGTPLGGRCGGTMQPLRGGVDTKEYIRRTFFRRPRCQGLECPHARAHILYYRNACEMRLLRSDVYNIHTYYVYKSK